MTAFIKKHLKEQPSVEGIGCFTLPDTVPLSLFVETLRLLGTGVLEIYEDGMVNHVLLGIALLMLAILSSCLAL